jgi:hypothetical protein
MRTSVSQWLHCLIKLFLTLICPRIYNGRALAHTKQTKSCLSANHQTRPRVLTCPRPLHIITKRSPVAILHCCPSNLSLVMLNQHTEMENPPQVLEEYKGAIARFVLANTKLAMSIEPMNLSRSQLFITKPFDVSVVPYHSLSVIDFNHSILFKQVEGGNRYKIIWPI